jgi:O-antigen ligase
LIQELLTYSLIASIGLVLAFLLSRLRQGLWIGLVLLIVSTTIAREPFGIPFEIDGLTIPMLAGLIWLRARNRLLDRKSYPLLIWVVLFLAANYITTAVNRPISPRALRELLILSLRAVMFYLVIMAVLEIGSQRRQIPQVLLLIAVVQVAASYLAYALLPAVKTPLVWPGLHGPGAVSLSGLFQEPNILGAFIGSVIALAIPLFAYKLDLLSRRKVAGVIVFITPALILSYTRSAWLATAGVLLLSVAIFALYHRERVVATVEVAALVVVVALASFAFGSVITMRPGPWAPSEAVAAPNAIDGSAVARESAMEERTQNFMNPSASGRLAIWRAALYRWQHRPVFGYGLLSYDVGMNNGWLYSSLIQTIHDSGLVGLLPMLAIVILVAWRTLSGYFVAESSADRAMLLGYFLMMAVMFVTSQFSSFFWAGYSWTLFGVGLGHSLAVIDRAGGRWPRLRTIADRATGVHRPKDAIGPDPTKRESADG